MDMETYEEEDAYLVHGRHGPALGHAEDAILFHFKDSLRANSKVGGALLPCRAAQD